MKQTEKNIYRRLKKLMKEEQLYTSPKINRKEIALKLETNEYYIHNIIKKYTGMSFAKYICSLRLKHACCLLKQTDNLSTVKDIASLSGFSSHKTFYRQFKNNYGMTPMEYKKMGKGKRLFYTFFLK